jgi:hypothetical protein
MILFILHMFFIPLTIVLVVILIFKALGVIYKMIEPKIEIVTKRQVAITLVGDDVDNLQKVLEAAQSADIQDRRLYGFAKNLCKKINEQRIMIKKMDEEDRQRSLRQLLDQYEETAIVDLTEVIPEDKKDESRSS